MKHNSNRNSLILLLFSLVWTTQAFAATSSATSSRTVVDTRNRDGIVLLKADLKIKVKGDRRLAQFESPWEAIKRKWEPVPSSTTYYFEINIPEFSETSTGWTDNRKGLGAYYGLEMKASGILGDSIFYKQGDKTSETAWSAISFNKILNIPVESGIHSFKVNVRNNLYDTDWEPPLNLRVRYKSARLCDSLGNPVKQLDPNKNLWILAHGKTDGEYSFRSMCQTIANRKPNEQIVAIDWASGADGWFTDLSNGRHFVSFGKSVAKLLENQGFSSSEKVHWVGHSWGSMTGCEVARSFGGMNRFVALDPAQQALGGYDDDRVDFGQYSNYSIGVRGRNGIFGSDKKARTADFTIRLMATKADGINLFGFISPPWLELKRNLFYHSLPRDWFEGLFKNGTYRDYLRQKVLWENGNQPSMPWGTWGKIWGMDLECHGETAHVNGVAKFGNYEFLKYNTSSGSNEKAEGFIFKRPESKSQDLGLWWSY